MAADETTSTPHPAAPAAHQFALLGTRRFLPLFLVQFLGAFNDQVYQKAFVALITYRLADEVGVDLGLLGVIASGLFILPFVLFTPTSGQLADRMDKAVMMRFVKGAEIVVMCLAVIGYHTQNIYFLYFVLFLMGTQSAVFAPIKYSVLPQYLHPKELIGGNGMVQAFTFLAIIFGSILGNELILTDAGVTIVSAVVVSVAIIGFIASLYTPPAPPTEAPERRPKVDYFFPRAIWMLIGRIRRYPECFRTILCISWFWFLGATFLSLLPAYVKETLGADEKVLTVLMTAFSVGVALGAIASESLSRGEVSVRVPPLGAIGIAVIAVEVWLATPGAVAHVEAWRAASGGGADALIGRGDFLSAAAGWRVVVDFALLAAFAGMYVTPLNAVLQKASPDDQRGRMIAASNVVDASFMVVSAIFVAICLAIGLAKLDVLVIVALTAAPMSIVVARYAPGTRFGDFCLSVFPRRPDA